MQNASSRVNIGLDYFDMKVKCKQIINVNVNHASRSHCKQFLCNTKQTQSQYCYTANKMKKVNMRCSCIHWLFNIPGCRGHREAQLSSRNRWMDCEYFQSHLIPFQVPQLGQFSSPTTPIPQTPILVPPSSFIAHPPHKHTHTHHSPANAHWSGSSCGWKQFPIKIPPMLPVVVGSRTIQTDNPLTVGQPRQLLLGQWNIGWIWHSLWLCPIPLLVSNSMHYTLNNCVDNNPTREAILRQ